MVSVAGIYSMRPFFQKDDAPVCDVMYKMRPMFVRPDAGDESQNTNNDPQRLESRQLSLLQKLDSALNKSASAPSLQGQADTHNQSCCGAMKEILKPNCPTDIVIRMPLDQPMTWLLHVQQELEKTKVTTWWKYHTHSTVMSPPKSSDLPSKVEHQDRHPFQLIVTVVTTCASYCSSLHLSPSSRTAIHGETNILRFFARLLGVYDNSNPADDVTMDLCLDTCDVIMSPSKSSQEKSAALKTVCSNVEKKTWFSSSSRTLGETFLQSVLKNFGVKNIPQEALKKWICSPL